MQVLRVEFGLQPFHGSIELIMILFAVLDAPSGRGAFRHLKVEARPSSSGICSAIIRFSAF